MTSIVLFCFSLSMIFPLLIFQLPCFKHICIHIHIVFISHWFSLFSLSTLYNVVGALSNLGAGSCVPSVLKGIFVLSGF